MSNKKISTKCLMIISKNLGQVYKDGIPINDGVELISETIDNKVYQQSLKKIYVYMNEGLSLSDSFKKFDSLYPKFFTGLISIGENTGNLYKVLCSISLFYEKYLNITETLKSACIYPAFIFFSIIALCVLLTEQINPSFYEIYKSMNINIPSSCSFLYNVKIFFEQNMHIALFSILCWGTVLGLTLKGVYSEISIERFRKIKIIRNIIEYITVLLFYIL